MSDVSLSDLAKREDEEQARAHFEQHPLACKCGRRRWDGEWWQVLVVEEDEETGQATLVVSDGVQNCYCSNCGDRCETVDGQPVLTRMVPASPSAAVRETRFWQELSKLLAAGEDGLTWIAMDEGDRITIRELEGLGLCCVEVVDVSDERGAAMLSVCTITPDGRTILAALEGGSGDAADLKAAVADRLTGEDEHCPLFDEHGDCCDAYNAAECIRRVEAWMDETLAVYRDEKRSAEATGQEPPGPTDAELLDALRGCDILVWRGSAGPHLEASCRTGNRELRARSDGYDLRDLARAILAAKGGAQ
jgi:hypothetical protein